MVLAQEHQEGEVSMENKMRLIDAKDFDLRVSQKKMSEVFPNWKEMPREVQDAVCKHAQYFHMLLETQATVDAAPVVLGRWIKYITCYRCSACSHQVTSADNYCPNCGAKMDSEN